MRGPIVPFEGIYTKHVAATPEEEKHANSRFDGTDFLASLYQAVGFNLKRVDDGKGNHHYEYVQGDKGESMKGKPPPKPTTPEKAKDVAGGPYRSKFMDFMYSHRPRKSLRELLNKYNIVYSDRNEDEDLRKNKTIGYEFGDTIKLAHGLDQETHDDVLFHEVSAKELLGTENRTPGDHEAIHDEIDAYAKDLKRRYINDVLDVMRN